MKIRFTGQTLPASIMEIPVSSNEIKFVKSLTQKKYRDQEGAFLVEGEKMVAEAIDSSFSVLKVYRLAEVGAKAMSRLSQTATPSPALAVVGKPEGLMLEDFSSLPSRGLFLALDGIRDPGNLGTIIRLADWFGISRGPRVCFSLREIPDVVRFFGLQLDLHQPWQRGESQSHRKDRGSFLRHGG